MNLLLDTHVWLWSVSEPERLGPETSKLLQNSDNEVYLSAVSSWEAGIKVSLGKLAIPTSLENLVESSLRVNHFRSQRHSGSYPEQVP